MKRLLPIALLAACTSATNVIAPPPAATPQRSASSQTLEAIANDYWQHTLDETMAFRAKLGLPIERLPDVTYAHAEREAAFASSLQTRLAAIDRASLSEDERISLGILKWHADMTVEGLRYFWLQSPVTPYASAMFPAHVALQSLAFKSPDDTARYLRLLDAYPLFINDIIDVVNEQQRLGIRIPKAEVPIVKGLLGSFVREPESSLFFVASDRLKGVSGADAFSAQVREAIASRINPALQRLAGVFDDAYLAAAPEAVGIGQYPLGKDAYRYLIRYHTTVGLTPEEIHAIGTEEIARINAEMQKVRDQLVFRGTKAEFHATLRKDPRFFAKSAEEAGARLTGYVRRIEPQIPLFFSAQPKAPYDVKRLDPNLEGSVTFGYYQWPTATDSTGHYYFNGSRPSERSLIFAASLMCHELIPGHHFQLARQSENTSIPPFRRESLDTAFVEGWGEYAANLGFEMGVYNDPYDRYGRLLMDSMIASRLVVDTGMNAFGWSRERASEYLRENTLMSDTEIATETLRYSVDIPGQALAYKIGSNQMLALRRRAKERLGPRFDIREFHEWLLASGSMPLGVLEEHVNSQIKAIE